MVRAHLHLRPHPAFAPFLPAHWFLIMLMSPTAAIAVSHVSKQKLAYWQLVGRQELPASWHLMSSSPGLPQRLSCRIPVSKHELCSAF